MALERNGGERVVFEREGCSVIVVVVRGGGVNGVVVVSTLRRESSEGGDSHGGGMMLARRCRLRRRASQRGMVLRYGGWREVIGPYMYINMKGGGELLSVGGFLFNSAKNGGGGSGALLQQKGMWFFDKGGNSVSVFL